MKNKSYSFGLSLELAGAYWVFAVFRAFAIEPIHFSHFSSFHRNSIWHWSMLILMKTDKRTQSNPQNMKIYLLFHWMRINCEFFTFSMCVLVWLKSKHVIHFVCCYAVRGKSTLATASNRPNCAQPSFSNEIQALVPELADSSR